MLFLDAEARIETRSDNVQDHSFRLGVGCFCTYSPDGGVQEKEQLFFSDEIELWNWTERLSADYKELLIISHNIDYDARLCRAFFYLPRLGWEPLYAIMARSCTMFVWERDGRKIQLLDNMNWWQGSLKQIGESIGIPKLQVDFETVSDEELFPYCHRDVEILVELWKQWFHFLDDNDLGNFGITAAKQAFNAYRHRFMPCKIGIHNNAVAVSLARESYRGGRSECFFVGQAPPGKYYQLDVNALYAAMMKWYPMPQKLVKVIQNVPVSFLDELLHRYLAVAEVVLEARDPMYVYRLGGRNCYPTGAFLTTLTTPELQIALINGEIRGVGRVALYEPADLFSGYVDYFTPLRAEYRERGNFAQAGMCKLLRNSLQGKFGQVGHKQEILGDAPLEAVAVRRWINTETGETCVDWTFGGKVIRQYSGGEPYDSLPSIPAHVAAYGRCYMWSLIQKAGREHTYYMDTDSLIVDEIGYHNLAGMIDSEKLGYLKVEGTTDDLEILARKDYRFGDLRTLKGIKDNAVRLAPDLYEQWHFTTLRYAFQEKNLDGVRVGKVRKRLLHNAVAGEIAASGWVTPPHLKLRHDDLVAYLADRECERVWVWEFDEAWLRRLRSLESLREKTTYSLSFLSSPSPRPQPEPLHLEPLSAA